MHIQGQDAVEPEDLEVRSTSGGNASPTKKQKGPEVPTPVVELTVAEREDETCIFLIGTLKIGKRCWLFQGKALFTDYQRRVLPWNV